MPDRKFASLNLFFLLFDRTTANPQKNYRIKIANPEAQKSYLTSGIRPKGKVLREELDHDGFVGGARSVRGRSASFEQYRIRQEL
jgi:hypothetical protein